MSKLGITPLLATHTTVKFCPTLILALSGVEVISTRLRHYQCDQEKVIAVNTMGALVIRNISGSCHLTCCHILTEDSLEVYKQ